MPYEVKLEVFEGPLDLLLHLITRQRVDIYEVSLATITEQYLAAVAELDDLDLETATGFLVVAATLLELKAARLLPGREADGADEGLLEERDLLLARLVECATYREAGAWIQAELARGEAWHGRTAGLEPEFAGLVPDLLARTRPTDLARAAARLLAPRPVPQVDVWHITPIKASVRDALEDVAAALVQRGTATFEQLCGPSQDRMDVIVRFLAVLELFKAGAIELGQATRWGDIVATWNGTVDPSEVLEDVEEYTLGARP